jgi:hypothetical protein
MEYNAVKTIGSRLMKQSSACYLLLAGFLLGIFFGPEDGGDILLRNVG